MDDLQVIEQKQNMGKFMLGNSEKWDIGDIWLSGLESSWLIRKILKMIKPSLSS